MKDYCIGRKIQPTQKLNNTYYKIYYILSNMCLGNHGNLRNLVVDPNHSLFFTYEFYIIPSISIIRLQLPKQPTFIHQLSLLNMCFGWCVVYTSLFLLAFFWKENVFHKQLGWYHPSWLPRWSSSGASRPIRSSPSMMAFRHLSSNCAKPIGSMYGTYTYIWLIFMVNVGEYTIHGSYGKRLAETFHWKSRLVHRTGPAKKTISFTNTAMFWPRPWFLGEG